MRSNRRRTRNTIFQAPHWIALILGLAVGLALGLTYTWAVDPLVELDTRPWQLSDAAKTDYLIAVSLAYRSDGDLRRAVDRLLELRLPQDPFQVLTDTACGLFRAGIDSNRERNAVEAMIALYRTQGRSGCADESALFAVAQVTPTPFPTEIPSTPTLVPPATKTATPNSPLTLTPPTVAPSRTPTEVPSENDFAIVRIDTFCSVELAGTIEVYVQLPGVGEVPGTEIRVTWDGGEDRFFTGLKPERGDGYADFRMEANRTYFVEIPGRSPRSRELLASACTTEDGQRSTTSYRVTFRRL